MKNQQNSVLIFKREDPKSARPRAFARFAQWLIRPCSQWQSDPWLCKHTKLPANHVMLFAISNENNIKIMKDQQTICNTAIHTDFSNAFQSQHVARTNTKTNLANCWSKNCQTCVCRQACSSYRSAWNGEVVFGLAIWSPVWHCQTPSTPTLKEFRMQLRKTTNHQN